MLVHERRHYAAGKRVIAGVDEAGRGSLAGPVVAGAVILPRIDTLSDVPSYYRGIKDSKKLSPRKREALYALMRQDSRIRIGVGIVEETVIDDINILQATFRAMREAVAGLSAVPDMVLVDGAAVPDRQNPYEAIVGGDAASISIAAASIVAKVTRDAIMAQYDAVFPRYGFKIHKGYGTKLHVDSLREYGPCRIHRSSFAPVKQMSFQWS